MDRTVSELDPITALPIGKIVTPGTPAQRPVARTFSGASVRLEALDSARHGDALWQLVGGLEKGVLWQYMSEGPFAERVGFDAALRSHAASEDPVFFAIVDQQMDMALGWCSLLNIHPKNRSVEVGHILFSTALQRTRGATEAMYLIARYVFEDLAYRRYEWKCNALNVKSRQAAERFGFVFEGLFRQHMIVKGRSRDTAWYSMLAEEWPKVRAKMERWLAPDNFDEHGRQKRRLSECG
jgi:RimJ/RimL family protein N-acetyltransferase